LNAALHPHKKKTFIELNQTAGLPSRFQPKALLPAQEGTARSPVIKCTTISNHVVARSDRNGTALRGNHDFNFKEQEE